MEIINISTLKAKISASLKRVYEGNTMNMKIKKPKHKFKIPESAIKIKVDPLKFLKDERRGR
jgi:hypothetical protein